MVSLLGQPVAQVLWLGRYRACRCQSFLGERAPHRALEVGMAQVEVNRTRRFLVGSSSRGLRLLPLRTVIVWMSAKAAHVPVPNGPARG